MKIIKTGWSNRRAKGISLPIFGIFMLYLALFMGFSLYSINLNAQDVREKNISLTFRGNTLKEVLQKIEASTDFQFVYMEEELGQGSLLTEAYENKSVDFILQDILGKNKLTYKQVGKNITIRKLENTDKSKGKLVGSLKDSANNEPLIGAIIITENKRGTQTDINGNFTLELPAGTYQITMKYTGYKDKVLRGIKIEENEVTHLQVTTLQSDTKLLNEVNISGTKTTNTNNALILEMRQAQSVISGISAEQIGRSQDRDAAEVVRRVSGVTVIQDRFIVIRGLPARYNTVMLNNAIAPSFEQDSKTFSFDVMPSGLIDRITVYKTAVPELPGDFAGGVVKIYTTGMPARNSFHFSYQSSYRPNTTFRPFFEQPQGKYAWLGYDDGTYTLPKDIPNPIGDQGDPDATAKFKNNNWAAQESTAPLDQRLNLDFQRKIKLSNSFNLGIVAGGGYYAKKQYTVQARNQWRGVDYDFYFADRYYNHSVQVNGMLNVTIDYQNKHKIEFKNLYSHLGTYRYLDRNMLVNPDNESPPDGWTQGQSAKQASFFNNYKGFLTQQITAKHTFMNGSMHLQWMGGRTESIFDFPDWKTNGGRQQGKYEDRVSDILSWSRLFQLLPETTYTAGMDIEQEIKIGSYKPKIKAGVFYENKDRYFNYRPMANIRNATFKGQIPSFPEGVLIAERFSQSNSYTAKNKLFASYFAIEIPFLRRFKLYGGLRREDNQQLLFGYYPATSSGAADFGAVTVDNHAIRLLPSGNLSFNFTNKTLVRLAAYKTLNRAEFREIAPVFFEDPIDFRSTYGNTHIIPVCDIYNYDLRMEHYPGLGQLLSLGVFYKKFLNPIEFAFIPSTNGFNTFQYTNALSAENYGAEIELFLSLNQFLKGNNLAINQLKKINLLMNAAYIYSQVQIGQNSTGFTSINKSLNRPLYGQSPYTINAQINFTDDSLGLKLNLAYNIIGARLIGIASLISYDIYETPRHSLDFTFSQRVLKMLEINGGIQNILDTRYVIAQDRNGDGKFDRNAPGGGLDGSKDIKTQSWYGGAYYTLGVGVRF